MISGSKRRGTRSWPIVALFAASCASATESEADQLAALFAALAQPVPSETAFVEQRESALLDEPLLLRGSLQRPRPGTLVRSVETPYRELTTVQDDRVRVEREGQRTRSFALRRSPELVAVLASFRALLDGDPGALQPHYEVQLRRDGAAWSLLLLPKQARLRERLGRITLRGVDDRLDCIATDQGNGGDSRMLMGEVAAQQPPAFDDHCSRD